MSTAPATARSAALARCDQEINQAHSMFKAGTVDAWNGYRWLNDWRAEKVLIEQEPE